uniref:Uncharacterized protein n=1 Tax=Oryza nivara TaxID=4536 RepID=A0A679BDE0_ORYNI|nr:hypothetical protein [Oryza sativa f. spontanea]
MGFRLEGTKESTIWAHLSKVRLTGQPPVISHVLFAPRKWTFTPPSTMGSSAPGTVATTATLVRKATELSPADSPPVASPEGKRFLESAQEPRSVTTTTGPIPTTTTELMTAPATDLVPDIPSTTEPTTEVVLPLSAISGGHAKDTLHATGEQPMATSPPLEPPVVDLVSDDDEVAPGSLRARVGTGIINTLAIVPFADPSSSSPQPHAEPATVMHSPHIFSGAVRNAQQALSKLMETSRIE